MSLNSNQAVVVREALRLYQSGKSHYENARFRETLAELEAATRLAAASGMRELEVSIRFWYGAALHGVGRSAEAIAVWAPVLARDAGETLSTDGYMMLTRYVLAAVEMPLPLDVVQRVVAEVENRVESSMGGARRRSRLLLARSRLALQRGSYAEALDLGLEGLLRSKREHPTYTYSSHFRTTARIGLLTDQPDLVSDLLDEWQRIEHAYPQSKRLALTAARGNLARYRGDPHEAMHLTENVARETLFCEDVVYCADGAFAYVRACLAVGQLDRARPMIARLLKLRHAAIGDVRFQVRLLRADYHLAMTRIAVSGHAKDEEFDRAGKIHVPAAVVSAVLNAQGAAARSVASCFQDAERACASAQREARRQDELLATRLRTDMVTQRRSTLYALVGGFPS